jgi:hypothetical protein
VSKYQQFPVTVTLWYLIRKAPGMVIGQHIGQAFVDKVLRGFPSLLQTNFVQFRPLKLDSFLPDAFQIVVISICYLFELSVLSKMKDNKNCHVKC